MIPTPTNSASLRSKIISCLRKLHASRSLDLESLAHDIWLEAFTNSTPLTYTFIRHRYINRWTSERLRKRHEDSTSPPPPSTTTTALSITLSDASERLSHLMPLAKLSPQEERVLFLTFWWSKSQVEIALDLTYSPDKVSSLLSSALDKLRRAGRILDAQTELRDAERDQGGDI